MSAYLEIIQAIRLRAVAAKREFPILVAVSKTKTVDEILAVHHEGQKVFGENYPQELMQKSEEIRSRGNTDLEFHFIGHLQRNKVKSILPHVTTIHSVDSIRLLEEIDKQARLQNWSGGVFIQINIDQEESKGGFLPSEVVALAHWIGTRELKIKMLGLMCIPNPANDPRLAFKKLCAIKDQYAPSLGSNLSMGMSSDYLIAVDEGATHLRIGSAIFGERRRSIS